MDACLLYVIEEQLSSKVEFTIVTSVLLIFLKSVLIKALFYLSFAVAANLVGVKIVNGSEV